MVNVNAFHLGSTIDTMAWSIEVDIVSYIIGVWG